MAVLILEIQSSTFELKLSQPSFMHDLKEFMIIKLVQEQSMIFYKCPKLKNQFLGMGLETYPF